LSDFQRRTLQLARKAPRAFREWARLVRESESVYNNDRVVHCSVKGHEVAARFGEFVRERARGMLLDIGCGPQPVPLYLEGYPLDWIAGVDPIEADHPFEFRRGVCESLPWPDDTFDVVTCATSFDHLVLPHQGAAEVARVLKPGRSFLLWEESLKEAKTYNPHSEKVERVDNYHLYRFSGQMLYEVFGPHFILKDAEGNFGHFVSLKGVR